MCSFKLFRATRIRHLVTLALFCAISSSPAIADIHLVFGAYTTEKPTTMVRIYRPILSALESALEEELNEATKISLQIESTYEAGIDALVTGDVDFSLLGPAPYVMAKERNEDIQILALDSRDQSRTFNGVICVSEQSPITEISQLRGKTFAFGNENSTIGRYLSQQYLAERGIFATDLAKFEYLGRHDRVGHAVDLGTYDAGALREGTFKKLKKKGLALRALATFPNINRPWVARANLDKRLFNALRQTMLNLSAPEAFERLGRKHFVTGTDADFSQTRSAIQHNNEFFEPGSDEESMTATEQ